VLRSTVLCRPGTRRTDSGDARWMLVVDALLLSIPLRKGSRQFDRSATAIGRKACED
jgi:hypothetical protein